MRSTPSLRSCPYVAFEIHAAVPMFVSKTINGPHLGDSVVDFLVKLFNVLCDDGLFPDSWADSIILPLFMQGRVNDPNNNRGIVLCDRTSKWYSSSINNRLQALIEQENVTGEWKADFKRTIPLLIICLISLLLYRSSFLSTVNCMWHLLTSKRHLIPSQENYSGLFC